MAKELGLATASIQTVLRESDNKLMIMTTTGLRTAEELGITFTGVGGGSGTPSNALTNDQLRDEPLAITTAEPLSITSETPLETIGTTTITGGDVGLNTLLAGENQERDWQTFIPGASERWPVESGQIDYLLGLVGSAGDYLDRIDVFITDSSKSQIVLRDGAVAPVLALTTHATTASTTTVINTAINALAVTADQFRGSLMKVGNEYRKVLTHIAFAAGVVNQYTLDRALSVAPAVSTAFTIEDRRYVFELAPSSTLVSGTQFNVRYDSKQSGLRISTESGVYLAAFGDFT